LKLFLDKNFNTEIPDMSGKLRWHGTLTYVRRYFAADIFIFGQYQSTTISWFSMKQTCGKNFNFREQDWYQLTQMLNFITQKPSDRVVFISVHKTLYPRLLHTQCQPVEW